MIAFIVIVAAVIALYARLATDVRQDRPVSPPRSHWHQADPRTAHPRLLS